MRRFVDAHIHPAELNAIIALEVGGDVARNRIVIAGVDAGRGILEVQVAVVVVHPVPLAVRTGMGIAHEKRVDVDVARSQPAVLDATVARCSRAVGVVVNL